jgi:hypothetical protein
LAKSTLILLLNKYIVNQFFLGIFIFTMIDLHLLIVKKNKLLMRKSKPNVKKTFDTEVLSICLNWTRVGCQKSKQF